jgi:hypothetical protein
VQSSPTIISERTWEAKVSFGTEELGTGEDYVLYAIITEEMLNEGLIADLPDCTAKSEVRMTQVEPPSRISWKYLYVAVIALVLILLPFIIYRKGKKQSKPSEEPVGAEEVNEGEKSEPENLEDRLEKRYPEQAARLASAFRIAQNIRNSYCNTDTTLKDISKEFDILKMYLTESEFLEEVENVQRRLNVELREDERLDEKHVEAVKDFCEKFTEMWIARFLR